MSPRRYSPAARRFFREEVRRRPLGIALFLLMSLVAAALEALGVGLEGDMRIEIGQTLGSGFYLWPIDL